MPRSSRWTDQIPRACVALVMSAAVVLLAPAAHAEAQADDGTAKARAHQAPMQAQIYDGLEREWRNGFIVPLDKEDFAELLLRVDAIDRVRLDNGIPNLFDAAIALSLAAQQRLEADDISTARHLSQAAIRLAPDLPQAHYVAAGITLKEDRKEILTALSNVFQGWSREWRHLPSRMRLLGGKLTLGLLTFLATIVIFALIQLRRHFVTLSHDVGHIFPRGVSGLQSGLFTLIILLLPFLGGLGVIALFVFWPVTLWWYQNRSEKVVTVLLLVGVALSPFIARVTYQSIGFFGSPSMDDHRCIEGACSEPQLDRLDRTCHDDGESMACFAVATVHERQAARSGNPRLFDRAIRDLDSARDATGTLAWAIETLRGNVYQGKAVAHCNDQKKLGIKGDDDVFRGLGEQAIAAYDRAATVGNESIPLFDKGQMLRRLGQSAEGDKATKAAGTAAAPELERVRAEIVEEPVVGPCTESFNANRMLAAPRLNPRVLMAHALRGASLAEVRLPFLDKLLSGRVTTGRLPAVAGVGLVLILLLIIFNKRVHPSWRCSTCNRVGCVRCRRELEHLDICEHCLFIQVKGSFVDAKDLWFRERRIQAEEVSRRRTARILSFVLPGVGHLYRGFAIAGTLFFVLFSLFLSNALVPTDVAPEMVPLPHSAGVVSVAMWGLAAFVVYVIQLVSIYRRKR